MSELKHIVQAARKQIEAGRPCVLASLMTRSGASYRRPCARTLISTEGQITGLIGGGCLEDDLIEDAMEVLETGQATLVDYDNSTEAALVWGHGLGCAGRVEILLERLDENTPGPLPVIARCFEQRKPLVLATLFDEAGGGPFRLAQRWLLDEQHRFVALDRATPEFPDATPASGELQKIGVHERDGNRWLIEPLLPPFRLLVFGNGYDVQPLIRFASELGWDCLIHSQKPAPAKFREVVTMLDEPASDAFNDKYIDDRTAVLLMTHHFETDRLWLAQVIPSRAAYIGALGPTKRLQQLLEGVDNASIPHPLLRGPVGLDIGGDSPEEIALSIIAEIQMVMHGRDATPLHGRPDPIHKDG